ncbi:MAG: glycosyltransferase [Ignavibacteria bacterium]|nr:glycosyltransferase [Ignavibacteria bacterium]
MTLTDVGLLLAACAMFGLLYPHAIYPPLLWIISKYFAKPLQTSTNEPHSIDIVLSAHNEEQLIGQCLTSVVESDYPKHLVRILVGDDGSTDNTCSIIESISQNIGHQKVKLFRFSRSGKNHVITSLVGQSTADIILFTDADCVVDKGALSAVNETLNDESVGAVVGMLKVASDSSGLQPGLEGETFYRRIEAGINQLESTIGSTVTSNGALYGVRRVLAGSIPSASFADDWVNLLEALRAGSRVVFNPKAWAVENRRVTMYGEIQRTIRTASAGMSTVWYYRSLLSPKYGWTSFFLLSHKIIRWASPLFMIALMMGTVLTVGNTMLFGTLLYGQIIAYGLALLGYAASVNGQNVPIASALQYFVAMNYSFLAAMVRFKRSQRNDQWNPNEGIGNDK